MKDTEFRRGNIIEVDKEIVFVQTIYAEGVDIFTGRAIDPPMVSFRAYEFVEGVQLDEFWLEKLGFENYGYGRWELHGFGNSEIGIHRLELFRDKGIVYSEDDIHRKIPFVHDLQNWVYGKTGLDLDISIDLPLETSEL